MTWLAEATLALRFAGGPIGDSVKGWIEALPVLE